MRSIHLFYLFLDYFLLCANCTGSYSYFHTKTNLSNLVKHLDDVPFTFVALFDGITSEERFYEYQDVAQHFSEISDLNVYYIIHDAKLPTEENAFIRFNLSYLELPYYLLFRGSQSRPILYRGSWKADDIHRWIALTTGLRIPLSGCINSLDSLAHDSRMSNLSYLEGYLLPTIRHVTGFRRYRSSEFAQYYRIVVERLIEHGRSYVENESKRLKKLIDSEVADWQKTKFKKRLNILTRFMPPTELDDLPKTEL